MAHGVKCLFDNISERKVNWCFVKLPLVSIHDTHLQKNVHESYMRVPNKTNSQRNFWNNSVGLSIRERKLMQHVAEIISVILVCNFEFYDIWGSYRKYKWKRNNLAGAKCPKYFGASWRGRNGSRRYQATTLTFSRILTCLCALHLWGLTSRKWTVFKMLKVLNKLLKWSLLKK